MTEWWLDVTAGDRTERVALGAGELTIGRELTADIALDDTQVSRSHAVLSPTANGWSISDLGSTNGTVLSRPGSAAERVSGTVELCDGDVLTIGSAQLVVGERRAAPLPDPGSGTPVQSSIDGDLSDELIATPVWSDEALRTAGIPIVDVPLVTIGGGLGSFALVDYLRVAGVPTENIAVLTPNDRPTETYEFLAGNSQIPRHERLRSDSGSVMDNIWGFPSYALREAWASKSVGPLWQVTAEPVLAEYYTPRSGQVYESVDRETARINWSSMLKKGQVRMVRRRSGGGYFSLLTPPPGAAPTRRIAYRSHHVHVSLGYPGVRFLPDLREYRERTGDHRRVVNSYESHPHVYAELARRAGTVLVRGSGIVASRVLQRLLDDNEAGRTHTRIIHLFRNYVHGPQGDSATFRRPGHGGFAYQAFNYPKAAWGGQVREAVLELEGEQRSDFIDTIGGTNTAPRKDWRQQLDRARHAGTYVQHIGQVETVDSLLDGQQVRTVVRDADGQQVTIDADFIVDATGLEASIRSNRVLADLVDFTGAQLNPKGRLDVLPSFEVPGTRSEPGRLYASGSSTLGGSYAPVDSFLGLQYSAQKIADDLASFGAVPRLGTSRSVAEWCRWMQNRAPK